MSGTRVDFFVSYASADLTWAEWTAFVLEDAGFVTLLQAWDFRPGSNFVLDMHEALRRSDRVLVILSDAYQRSAFAGAEWAAAFADDPQGQQGRLVPVRVEDCEPEGLLRAVVRIELVGLAEPEARRQLLAGVAQARAKPGRAPDFPGTRHLAPSFQPFPGKLPAVWNLPARNPNFAGRGPQLDELGAVLGADGSTPKLVAVSGLGGVGKTQLAIEYVWRRAADFDLVWWVPAEVPPAIGGYLTPLAERLGLPVDDPATVVRLLFEELRRRDRWLVVFDNAEDPSTLAAYLPSAGSGSILVTSRNPSWRARGATLALDVLPPDEAVAFLLARTGSDDDGDARAVAEELGSLPLALEQAGAYVDETGMTLSAYRELLSSRRGDLMVRGTPAFYRETVAATFGLAYDRALAESLAAAEVLGICAFLAPDDIPTELVASNDALADEDVLAALRRLALLRRQGDSIAVHRLVGAVVRERMGAEEAAERARAAVSALGRAFPDPADDHRSWPRSARLLSHVLAVAQHTGGTHELARLLNSAGIYLWSSAQLDPAREVLEQALGMSRAAYGLHHPDVARTLTNLGIVQRGLGNLAAARDSQERALEIFEAADPADPTRTARTLTNLGLVLRDLGDLAGARGRLERALAIEEASYGPEHPEVARTLSNLGAVLRGLGDLAGARERQERALAIEEAAYGPDHPEVAITLANLGIVLQSLGDLAGARERQERALAIEEAAYGPDHPEVAIVLGNLGNVLQNLGDLDGAREHLAHALGIFEASYGPNHPDVAIALTNLAIVLRDLGDLAGARDHQERAIGILETAYGADHARTRAARSALGTC